MSEAVDPYELASRVSDGEAVDWNHALRVVGSEDSTVVRNLSRISELMSAHRRLVREHLPFETWGKLRLLEKIGEGSYGEVFRAWDESLGREVALKLFRQKKEGASVRASISSQQAEELMLEARRLARIRHENVVQVYGAEEHRGRAGFWMELVDGETLASILHGHGAMDADEASEVGIRLASGLTKIHKAGLLHRDVKAQNVMRDSEGRIVLTDMGAGVDLRFTTSGLPRSIAGTPLYMAPELLTGRGGDHRVDIYSVGILLYHLVTGRFPYESQTYEELQRDHLDGNRVGLLERNPELPLGFIEVVERATAHDPRNRFQSASEMEEALRILVGDRVREPSRGRIRAWTHIVLPALIALLVVTGGLWTGREMFNRQAVSEATSRVERGQIQRLTYSGSCGIPLWSPDGETIAFSERLHLQLLDVESGVQRELNYPDDRVGIPWGWTPDSKAVVAYVLDQAKNRWDVYRVGVLNGEAQLLAEDGMFPTVSPDGRKLAFANRSPEVEPGHRGIDEIDLNTGERRTLVLSDGPGTAVYKPLYSPDGKELAYSRWVGYGHELWIMDLSSSEVRQVDTGALIPGGHYCFTPDGQYLLSGANLRGVNSIWKFAVDGSSQTPLTEGNGGALQEEVSVSPDGQSFAFKSMSFSGRLAMIDLETGDMEYATSLDVAINQPAYGSDGKSIYFQVLANGKYEIWSLDPTAERPRPVISDDDHACFSPRPAADGILHLRGDDRFTSVFGEVKWPQSVWTTSEDGGRSRRWEEVGNRVSRLAPSGEMQGRILYSQSFEGGESFHVAERNGAPREIARDGDDLGIYSFDWGRSADEVILLVGRGDGGDREAQIEAVDLGTGEFTELVEWEALEDVVNGAELGIPKAMVSSPSGSEIGLLFQSPMSSMTRVMVYDRITGEVRLVQELTGEEYGDHLIWAPDGRTLALSLTKYLTDIYLWESLDIVQSRAEQSTME